MLNKLKLTPIVNILIAVVISVSILFFGYKILNSLGVVNRKASLSVKVKYGEAEVYLNNKKLGTTPIEELQVKSGENKLKVDNDKMSYEVVLDFLVKPRRSFETASVRDLGVSDVFSSGINFWFEEKSSDSTLSVISEPSDASVYIDNNRVGTTPYTTGSLTPGEYNLRIVKSGYESQNSRFSVDENYQLNVSAKLFPTPVSTSVSTLPDSFNLYDIASDDSLVTSDTKDWVDAIIYWNKTRGIDLSGVGLNKEPVFDYFVDYKGNVYDQTGSKVSSKGELGSIQRGAYLRRISEGPGLSDSAKQTLENLEILGGKKATINYTGTGWLNVRSQPSLDGELLTKVDVGDSYAVLEESGNWVKLRVSSDVQGWVSGTYVTIIEE